MRVCNLLAIVAVVYLFMLASCTDSGGIPGVTAQQQLALDTAAIGKYLSDNSILAYKDASGLRFVIHSMGTGFSPRLDNEIVVAYTARLISNGTIVDSGTKDAVLSTFISGWQIGLSLLPKGSTATLYIPSGLAFGTQSDALIPANSNLIYDVALTDVITTSAEQTQLTTDVAAVDTYLSNHQITAVQDTTGLRYIINTAGSGLMPTWLSKVSITYTLKELSTGNIYYSGTVSPTSTFDSRVVNYIRAFQVGLQKMHKGGTATFYVPSGLAFGSIGSNNGNVTVPANTNLTVDMQLVDVSNLN